MNDLTNIIASTRAERSLTLRAFAEEINKVLPDEMKFTFQLVSLWEHGTAKPSYLLAHRLASVTEPSDWRHSMALSILRNYAPEIWCVRELGLTPAPAKE